MSIRNLSTTVKNILKNNSQFTYAHLVKFEKPAPANDYSVNSANNASDFSYFTDAGFDIEWDDNSNNSEGVSNGDQTYVAGKLLSVGNTSETVVATATNTSIVLDATAIGVEAITTNTIFNSSTKKITVNFNLIEEGFREGDIVRFTRSDGSTQNNDIAVRIETFVDNEFSFTYSEHYGTITQSQSTAIFTARNISEELVALTGKKNSTSTSIDFNTYLNREVFIYKILIDKETGTFADSDPFLIFKGLITSGSLQHDATKGSKVTWALTSHWGDFARINGRLTLDEQHRALDGAGISDPGAVVRSAYSNDFGFQHSNKALNVMGTYNRSEIEYYTEDINGDWFGGIRNRQRTLWIPTKTELSFNLNARYLPVIYGVNSTDTIPIFVDTDKDDPSNIFVAYAVCEGEIGGIYDIYLDGNTTICGDKADADARDPLQPGVEPEDVNIICSGRADRGDVLPSNKNYAASSTGSIISTISSDISNTGTIESPGTSNDFVLDTLPEGVTVSGGNRTRGLLHREIHNLSSAITGEFIVHTGKPDQKVDSVFLNMAQQQKFKIQDTYYEDPRGKTSYWTTNHRLLDTAYVAAKFKISEGETQIPALNFVVRGKGINCHNYDRSFSQDFSYTNSSWSEFSIGDEVELFRSADNVEIGSGGAPYQIKEIFTFVDLDGFDNVRAITTYNEDVDVPFYMRRVNNNSDKIYFLPSYNEQQNSLSGTISTEASATLDRAATNSNTTSESTLNKIYFTSPSEAFQEALSNYSNFFTFDSTPIARFETLGSYNHTNDYWSQDFGNIGQLNSSFTKVILKDVVFLGGSASSTDNAYNNRTLRVRRYNSGKSYIERDFKIEDYDGQYKIAKLSTTFDSDFIPTVGDTFRILEGQADLRVSINPAMQLLDYLTNTRYGRGLLVDDINIDSFKQAARECDTRSDITVIGVPGEVVQKDAVYRYPQTGTIQFQGRVKEVRDVVKHGTSSTYKEVIFTDVIGKLGNRYRDYRPSYEDNLYWENGVIREKLNSSASDSPEFTTGANWSAPLTSLELFNIDSTVIAAETRLTLDITELSANKNPIVKSFVANKGYSTGTFIGSGYSLYDADDVKYWRYLGWNDFSQRNVTRHQTNQTVATAKPLFENINAMLQQFNGILRYDQGQYSLDVKKQAPDFSLLSTDEQDFRTITQEDIIGNISVKDTGVKNSFNSMSANIKDPSNKYQTRSVNFFNSEYLKQDKNIPKKGDINVNGVTNYFNARLQVGQALEQSRFGLDIQFRAHPKHYCVVAGELIQITEPSLNWSNKLFRVMSLTLNSDCTVTIKAKEHNDSSYLISNISSPIYGGGESAPQPPNPKRPDDPSNFTTTENIQGLVRLNWTNAANFDENTMSTEIWEVTPSAVQSQFCQEEVGDFNGNLPQSNIELTVINTSSTTVQVQVKSTTSADIDALDIDAIPGTTVSAYSFNNSTKVASRNITFTGTPPSNFGINVLWSKTDFAGNYSLNTAGNTTTITFAATCNYTGVSSVSNIATTGSLIATVKDNTFDRVLSQDQQSTRFFWIRHIRETYLTNVDSKQIPIIRKSSFLPNNTTGTRGISLLPTSGAAGADGPQGTKGPDGTKGSQGTRGAEGTQGPQGTKGLQGTRGATGPAGPAGTAGDPGPKGPTGTIGPTGPAGPAGTAGPQGSVGTVGPTGPAGPAGTAGPQGSVGTIGPQGTAGPKGPAGTAGPQGTVGPAGTAGPKGPAGTAGPQGTVGPQGTTGPVGTAGPKGPAGTIGPQGTKGSQGTQGPQGTKGNQGTKGPTGPQGPQGTVGNQGTKGPTGTTGTKGPQGTVGNQGTKGPTGTTGPKGPQGTVGNQGTKGPTGTQGTQGPQGTKGNQGTKGPTGPQGPQGTKGPTGTRGPKGPQGTVGNQGTKGPTGTRGPKGPQGTVGNQGTKGPTGTQGTQGPQGTVGNQGTKGPTGPQGPQGTVGNQGTKGPTGTTGTKGPQGTVGNQGTKGPQGTKGNQGPKGPTGTVGVQGTQGPQGTTGPKGPQGTRGTQPGPKGPQGTTGEPGPQGPRGTEPGPKGPQGTTGPKGPQGTKGNQGPKGPTGTTGTKGPQGTVGNQGTKGPTGPQGPQGTVGNQGTKGPTGPKGPQGTVGNQGTKGPTGTTGPKGPQGTVGNQGTKGPTGTTGTKGPQGTVGNQGTKGPTGTTGPKGPQGTKGNQGPKGPQGTVGNQGTKGPTGTRGTKGPQGTVGNQGTKGPTGTTGPKGPQGTVGNQGTKGPTGTRGPKGPQGTVGNQGTKGPTGPKGPQGTVGNQGTKGPTGTTGTKGTKGPQGTRGNQGTKGTKGPQGTVGNQGTKGPTGTRGPKGPQGTVGNQGTKGPTGTRGPKGPQGTVGNQGTKGPTGTTGPKGPQGTQGNQGTKGPTGTRGTKGPQGTVGNQGTKGPTGTRGPQGTRGDEGPKGPTGTIGPTGPVGQAGNAIVFDTLASTKSDGGSDSKSDLIRTFRGVNNVLINDVYWHIQSGQVYQYQGAQNVIDDTTDVSFTLLNRTDSNPNGGFLNPDSFIVGNDNDRVEFSSKGLKIFSGGSLRVVLGDLT